MEFKLACNRPQNTSGARHLQTTGKNWTNQIVSRRPSITLLYYLVPFGASGRKEQSAITIDPRKVRDPFAT